MYFLYRYIDYKAFTNLPVGYNEIDYPNGERMQVHQGDVMSIAWYGNSVIPFTNSGCSGVYAGNQRRNVNSVEFLQIGAVFSLSSSSDCRAYSVQAVVQLCKYDFILLVFIPVLVLLLYNCNV